MSLQELFEMRYPSTLELDAEVIAHVDARVRELAGLAPQAMVPCEVEEASRPDLCGRSDEEEHQADVEVLLSCGCVVLYCVTAYETWVLPMTSDEMFSCEVPTHPASIVSAMRWFR